MRYLKYISFYSILTCFFTQFTYASLELVQDKEILNNFPRFFTISNVFIDSNTSFSNDSVFVRFADKHNVYLSKNKLQLINNFPWIGSSNYLYDLGSLVCHNPIPFHYIASNTFYDQEFYCYLGKDILEQELYKFKINDSQWTNYQRQTLMYKMYNTPFIGSDKKKVNIFYKTADLRYRFAGVGELIDGTNNQEKNFIVHLFNSRETHSCNKFILTQILKPIEEKNITISTIAKPIVIDNVDNNVSQLLTSFAPKTKNRLYSSFVCIDSNTILNSDSSAIDTDYLLSNNTDKIHAKGSDSILISNFDRLNLIYFEKYLFHNVLKRSYLKADDLVNETIFIPVKLKDNNLILFSFDFDQINHGFIQPNQLSFYTVQHENIFDIEYNSPVYKKVNNEFELIGYATTESTLLPVFSEERYPSSPVSIKIKCIGPENNNTINHFILRNALDK